MTCVIAGIDFGTSNSAVSVSVNFEKPRLIQFDFNGIKYNTIPSVVSYCDDGRILYGRAAIEAYQQGDITGRGRFIRSIKRIVSSDLKLHETTRICGRNIRFIDIVRDFFYFLKQHAEQEIQHPIDYVVIGRPVSFVDNNKEQDMATEREIERIATQEIGFRQVKFQYEPIAAAFAHEQNISRETLALIVDIGAGTSDFSVIRLLPKSQHGPDRGKDILANTGINIAGNDFDSDFALHSFMESFGYKSRYKTLNGSLPLPNGIFRNLSNWTMGTPDELIREYARYANAWISADRQDCIARLDHVVHNYEKFDLLSTIEKTKIYLTDKPDKRVRLGPDDNSCVINVSRDDLERGLYDDLGKIQDKIDACIAASGKSKTDIQMLIFTGGSSQIPVIQLNVTKMFPHIKPENILKSDVFSSVCVGLAYNGMNLWRNN